MLEPGILYQLISHCLSTWPCEPLPVILRSLADGKISQISLGSADNGMIPWL